MTVEEIKQRVSLRGEFERRGIKLIPAGPRRFTCLCPIHKDRNPSLSVDDEKGLWNCHACKVGGSVIDLYMKVDGISFKEAFIKLGGDDAVEREDVFVDRRVVTEPEAPSGNGSGKPKIQKVYSYQDANGREVFQVVRCEGKKFYQRHPVGTGWVDNMQGVERVLYHLPEVLRAEQVWIVEGEKDADTLVGMGLVATCNVGGAGKWLDGYTESLKGKDVVLCGDNDKPGQEHVELVQKSIADCVKTSRVVKVPPSFKDVTEWVESFSGSAHDAKRAVVAACESAQVFIKGIDLPVLSMFDMQDRYVTYIEHYDEWSLSLSKWLPSFSRVRKLVPGEVVTFIADTGVGKTAILSHIAYYARPLKVLMFEMELPDTLLFERFLQQAGKLKAEDIESEYKRGVGWGPGIKVHLDHIYCCPKSGMDITEIERILNKAELKMGERPRVVLIDYIQLAKGMGKSRYESTANVAEAIKVMAKTTQTIVICGSQMSRKPKGEKDSKTVGLHDAKNAGEIENSCGLLIGATREENSSTMILKVLKNQKGATGFEIACNFDGPTMCITEQSKAPEPVPESSKRYAD